MDATYTTALNAKADSVDVDMSVGLKAKSADVLTPLGLMANTDAVEASFKFIKKLVTRADVVFRLN